MRSKPFNKILARYPASGKTVPTLWDLPGQGVYLTHSDSLDFIRICSKQEFLAGVNLLIGQGWILEPAER
jgi:hypothetical protein